MILCTFSLPLQSHLAIPEDAPFFFKIDGRLVLIHARVSEGAKLFSYSGEDYTCVTSDEGVDNRHFALVNETGERIFFRQVYRKTAGESCSGGIVDLLKYTHLQISFEIESVDVLNTDPFAKTDFWGQRIPVH